MDPFLAAQADDPFDPAPMLIQADWLEEAGDPVGAEVLRGLAESGTLSLHALALEATLASVSITPDDFIPFTGHGRGHRRGHGQAHGDGDGDGHEIWDEYGYGSRCGFGYDHGDGHGPGIGDGFVNEHGDWHGAGYGDRDG